MGQNAIDRTFFTLDAQARIQLPDHFLRRGFAEKESRQAADRQTGNRMQTFKQKIPSFQPLARFFICHPGLLFPSSLSNIEALFSHSSPTVLLAVDSGGILHNSGREDRFDRKIRLANRSDFSFQVKSP
jgi:hypothetical protein